MESKGANRRGSNQESTAIAAKISEATKVRLNSLVGKFESFESEMLEGTRQRREKDEHVLTQLRADMAKLEQILESETKKREEMTKSLQIWCGEQVEESRELLLEKIHERMEKIEGSIEALNGRVDSLEAALEYQKVAIPADIERRGAELTAKLTAFQERFETERLSRLDREREIVGRLAEHENLVAEELNKERNEREQKYQELKSILEESVVLRKSRTERFHLFLEKEIAVLKNAVQEESILREKEDDEIVETLTRYTAKLQDSLRVINTTEV